MWHLLLKFAISNATREKKETRILVCFEWLGATSYVWRSNKLFDFCLFERQRAADPIKFALDLPDQRG